MYSKSKKTIKSNNYMYPQVGVNGHTHTIQFSVRRLEDKFTCTDRLVVPWETNPRIGLILRWVIALETLVQLNGLCSGNGTSMADPHKNQEKKKKECSL